MPIYFFVTDLRKQLFAIPAAEQNEKNDIDGIKFVKFMFNGRKILMNGNRTLKKLALTVFFILFLLYGYNYEICDRLKAEETTANKNELTVIPKEIRVYFHSFSGVQYLGFLMAQKCGFYEKAGLPPVVFFWSGPQAPGIDVLSRKKAEFAVTWMPHACAIQAKQKNLTVISRMAKHSSLGVKVRKDLNPSITDIHFLAGKKLSATTQAEESALAYARALKIGDKIIRRRTDGLNIFREGYIDGLFYTSYEWGVFARFTRYRNDLNFFSLEKAGFTLPEDVLICSSDFYENHKDLCRKFVQAVWLGWQEVVKNPSNAINVLKTDNAPLSYYFDPHLADLQLKEWFKILDFSPEMSKNGVFSENDYNQMREVLIRTQIIAEKDFPVYSNFVRIVPLEAVGERIPENQRK